MNSKIKVEHEFGTGVTWLQLYVSTVNSDGTQPDLRDLALKNFVEKAADPNNQFYLGYPENNHDNSVVSILVGPKPDGRFRIWENSKELEAWLNENNIKYQNDVSTYVLETGVDPFAVGAAYGRHQQIQNNKPQELNWVGLNAKCLKEVNDNFKVGKSYNLLMATGTDHKVYAQGSGHVVRTNDEMEFAYLAEFVKAWEINDVGRFDVSK